MTRSQVRLVVSLAACVAAVGVWIWSYFVFPGRGYLRTFLLFAAVLALVYPYQDHYLAVSREHPLNPTLIGGIIAAWLFAVLGVILFAQSRGFHAPTARGPNRPVGYIVVLAPFVLAVGWRFLQIYSRLGRASI